MNVRKARFLHQQRPLDDRLRDERGLEPLASSPEMWAGNPEKFDLLRVDTPVPRGMRITGKKACNVPGRKSCAGIMRVMMKGEEAGYLEYMLDREKGMFHVGIVEVHQAFEGRGLSALLLREFVNVQDRVCLPATIEPYPTFRHHATEMGEEQWAKRREELDSFYRSYGFETFKDRVLQRSPVCRRGR